MGSDDELYKKLINMWDKREYMAGALGSGNPFLGLEVKSNAADMVKKIYNDTGDDRERTIKIFEKALKNYDKHAVHYGDISTEVSDFKSNAGNWLDLKLVEKE